VINGFTNAAAIIIATSQLPKLFGVYVDKGEHHYETVYRVILAAVDYTHLPTLAMGVLAFALMLGLHRFKPRLPNVLIAVVASTLLSFFTGFNNDHPVGIKGIESEEIRNMVQEFNYTNARENVMSKRRVLLGKELHESVKEESAHAAGTLKVAHEIAVQNVEIVFMKEKQEQLREELRSAKFHAVEVSDGELKFYPVEDVPQGEKIIGGTWRMKVGRKPIVKEKIMMMGGGAIVGRIPSELPGFKAPALDMRVILSLLPMTIIIAILGFMEAISIAKAMAAKTQQRLDPNQELVGQGLSNILGSCFLSYTVSGSFSRSAVNLQAGAKTGLSNVFSSVIVGVTILFLTPLLYHLPQAVLAAIIMVAVIGLVNVRGFKHAWNVHRYDGAISIVTFITTLYFAPHLDRGLFIGVALSIGLYLKRNMKPDVYMLAKYVDGSFLDAKTYRLRQCEHIAVIRFSGPLFFADVAYFEDIILEAISSMRDLRHVLIVGNGINEVDASGEEFLYGMIENLRESGYDVSFSGLNESVLATFRRTNLYETVGKDHFFHSVAQALESIHEPAHFDSIEEKCPLKTSPGVRS
jgi:MFS superfamily sulfate permease-like transporter